MLLMIRKPQSSRPLYKCPCPSGDSISLFQNEVDCSAVVGLRVSRRRRKSGTESQIPKATTVRGQPIPDKATENFGNFPAHPSNRCAHQTAGAGQHIGLGAIERRIRRPNCTVIVPNIETRWFACAR